MKETAAGCGVVAAIIGFVVIMALTSLGWWYFEVRTSGIKGKGDAEITINKGANRIAEYDHFFALCTSVQDAETTIDSQTALLNRSTNATDKSLANANISANEITREKGIHEYNQAALKWTTARFQDSDLPYQLSDAPYVSGKSPHTQCALQ